MNEFWNWLKKVLSKLMESLLDSSNSTTLLSPTTPNQSDDTSETHTQKKSDFELAIENAKKELSSAAIQAVTTEGLSLLGDYKEMINSLSPKQKEYVMNIAILKTQNFDAMTAEEIIELGELSVKTSELGLEVSEELSTFWNKFADVVSALAEKFQEIGTKVLATSLVGVLF